MLLSEFYGDIKNILFCHNDTAYVIKKIIVFLSDRQL